MPPMVEQKDQMHVEELSLVPRSKYIEFIKANPNLEVMPRQLRLDLDPLPSEIAQDPKPVIESKPIPSKTALIVPVVPLIHNLEKIDFTFYKGDHQESEDNSI